MKIFVVSFHPVFPLARMESNSAPVDVVKSELNGAISSLPNVHCAEDLQIQSGSPGEITSEQESYVKGFDEALQNIHLKEQFQLPNAIVPNCNLPSEYYSSNFFKQSTNPNYESINSYFHGSKNPVCRSKSFGYTSPFGEDMNSASDHLPIYPAYDSISPFPPFHFITDMEEQEHLKRERKRIRNRLAASKCRKKRLEREARLEEDVKSKEDDFSELKNRKMLLEKEVLELKNTIQSHHLEGCNV